MAQEVIRRLVCDVCKKEAGSTTTFSAQGRTYETELCEQHEAAFEKALAPYVTGARRVGGKASSKRQPGPDLSVIRAWANNNGFEVSPVGRIPSRVVEAYKAVS